MTNNSINKYLRLADKVLQVLDTDMIPVIARQNQVLQVAEILEKQGFDSEEKENKQLIRYCLFDSQEAIQMLCIALYERAHRNRTITHSLIEMRLKQLGKTWGDLEIALYNKQTNNLSRSFKNHSKIKDLELILEELDLEIVSKSE